MKRIIIWGLAAGLMLGFSTAVQAQDSPREGHQRRGAFIDENADGLGDGMVRMHRRGGPGAMRENPLTEEQQAELKALVAGLKESEATPEEVRAAVEGQFAAWGVDMPERPEGHIGFGKKPEGLVQVTEEQRAAIDALIGDLKANEATPEEIRAALQAQLADLGIELPERPEGMGGRLAHGKPGRLPEGWTPGDLPEGWTPGERPEGWGDREKPERPEGADGATLRRGAARKLDNRGIEDMMLRTQGKRRAE